MSELGKPKEFSAKADSAAGVRPGKGAITVTIALVVLAVVMLAVSGCVPTP